MGYRFHKFTPKASRKAETQTIKSAIDSMLDASDLGKQYRYARMCRAWTTVLGNSVAKRTEKVFAKDGKLFVKIISAPLKKELSMNKGEIIPMLNQSIGERLIADLVFI